MDQHMNTMLGINSTEGFLVQSKLTSKNIMLIIPPSESTEIEYHPDAVKVPVTYIFKVLNKADLNR